MNKIENDHQGQISIGQVAAATGVGKSTLRHWEREFKDFLDTARTTGNQRRFAPDATEKIERIRTLVEEQGMTLRGVRRELERSTRQEHDTGPPHGKVGPTVVGPEDPIEEKARRLADLVSDRLLRRLME